MPKTKAAFHIAAQLRELIVRGQLAAGEPLPVESDLTVEFAGHLSTKLFDDDHHLVGIDAGSFTVTLEVDLGDPEDPEDDVIVEGPITEHGLRTLGERDLCQDLLDFVG